MALFDPLLEVVAVTATGESALTPNRRRKTSKHSSSNSIRLAGRAEAASPDQPLPRRLAALHGHDGLGNANFPVAGLVKVLSAEKVLGDEVRAAPEDITIVIALGPLTNIARAMHIDHTWASQVGRLIVSGGTITAPVMSRQPPSTTCLATHSRAWCCGR